jgi:hypothetical protein
MKKLELFLKGFLNLKVWASGFVTGLIVMLIVSLIGCRDIKKTESGIIAEKFIEIINVKALFDSMSIESTKKDKMSQELYVVKIKGNEAKIYINLFCYENYDVGDEIVFSDCGDIRFETEY